MVKEYLGRMKKNQKCVIDDTSSVRMQKRRWCQEEEKFLKKEKKNTVMVSTS